MAATSYLVFESNGGDQWLIVGTYQAASGDAAKAAAAVEHGEGTYAATPARSWAPSAFKVQSVARPVKP